MKIDKHSRRMFLQGASGAALAIPWLTSLLPREARSQTPSIPKRYIGIWSEFDYGHTRHWHPTLNPLTQTMQKPGEVAVTYQSLRSLLGSKAALSRALGPGLTPLLGSINVMRSLDFLERTGHGWGHSFGNYASSEVSDAGGSLAQMMTIDQVLGRNPRINPHASEPFVVSNSGTSVSCGPDGSGRIGRVSAMATTPQGVYQSLFRNGGVLESGGSAAPHPRRDVLSRVLDDYRRVRNGPQISSTDKIVLDNALDKLSEVHRAIEAETSQTNGCYYKNIPRTGSLTTYDSTAAYKNLADLLVAAMMCDLNRVFNFSGYINSAYYNKSNQNTFHEGHSHEPHATIAGKVNHEYLAEVQGQLVANFVVPLLNGMSSAVDAANGKSILYNSLVHFTLEHSTVHSFADAPALLAGNAGGVLTTGHMIDYANRALGADSPGEGAWDGDSPNDPLFSHQWSGLPVQRLFVTILQAMGLQRSDYERTDINQWYRNRTDGAIGAHNNNIAEVGGYGYVGMPNPKASQWEMHNHDRYHDYNLTYFKDPLPLPPTSAA